MQENSSTSLTDKNLDRLIGLLNQALEQPTVAMQLPSGAHIFHGAAQDPDLTQNNLKLASKILLGIALGYVEEAPLLMVFEHKPGEQTVIDLSMTLQKRQAETWIETFQEQSQHDMSIKLNKLLAA